MLNGFPGWMIWDTNITSSLFEEEKMNLNADMSVLETLLKKDGLIEDEMNLEQLNAMMKE